MLKHLGIVCSEGGPLVFGDKSDLLTWTGALEEGGDYAAVCNVFDTDPALEGFAFSHGDNAIVVWEMTGGGGADIFRDADGDLIVIRCWVNSGEVDDPDILRMAGVQDQSSQDVGEFRLVSNRLTIMWAAESGECLSEDIPVDSFTPSRETCMENTALIVSMRAGVYACLHDVITLPNGASARRCAIRYKDGSVRHERMMVD
jgi:hypothetical protein